jgi:hypothetical protein
MYIGKIKKLYEISERGPDKYRLPHKKNQGETV